jgi:hypothetical protein
MIFVTFGGEARRGGRERGRGIPLSGNSKVCTHARPSSQGGLDIRRPSVQVRNTLPFSSPANTCTAIFEIPYFSGLKNRKLTLIQRRAKKNFWPLLWYARIKSHAITWRSESAALKSFASPTPRNLPRDISRGRRTKISCFQNDGIEGEAMTRKEKILMAVSHRL